MSADKPAKRPTGLVGLIVMFPGRHHTHDSDGGSLRNAADTAGELEHVVIGLPDTYEEGLNVSGRQLGGGLLNREPSREWPGIRPTCPFNLFQVVPPDQAQDH